MGTEFEIRDEQLALLRDNVVILTGGSSGIGLATVQLLLDCGAHVYSGDLNASPITHDHLTHHKVDVTNYAEQLALFKGAMAKHARIDHVFANAGIGPRVDYMESQTDEHGDPLEPDFLTYDINLRAMVNTCHLALHYMRKQAFGGSIVATASASSFQPFGATDYGTAKHGVLGFMRGTAANLKGSNSNIRINAIAPSWTVTGLLPEPIAKASGMPYQFPDAVARAVALLMADAQRQAQLLYIVQGRYKEIDEVLLKAKDEILEGEEEAGVLLRRMYDELAKGTSNPT